MANWHRALTAERKYILNLVTAHALSIVPVKPLSAEPADTQMSERDTEPIRYRICAIWFYPGTEILEPIREAMTEAEAIDELQRLTGVGV